jgi:hypothetical protein
MPPKGYRTAQILARKRKYGQCALTFAEIGKLLNARFNDLAGRQFGLLRVLGYAGVHELRQTLDAIAELRRSSALHRCLPVSCRSCGCSRNSKSSERLRTLYFLEKQLGAKAMASLTRLSMMDKVSEIIADVLGHGRVAEVNFP